MPNTAGKPTAIRNAYAQQGVREYYQQEGAHYRNPHEPIVRELVRRALETWQPDTAHVLDLACGSGEVTLALREQGVQQVIGTDPYTAAAYHSRTGQTALGWSFEDIAGGALEGAQYSLVVCSFALHLAADSWLPSVCYQLARVCPSLLILTPHKRPEILPAWGWQLHAELQHERVRARLYHRNISP